MQFVPQCQREPVRFYQFLTLDLYVDYYIVDVIKLGDDIKKEDFDNFVHTDVIFRNGGGSGKQCAGIYS